MTRSYRPRLKKGTRPVPSSGRRTPLPPRDGWWRMLLHMPQPCVVCGVEMPAGSSALRTLTGSAAHPIRFAHDRCIT